MASIAQLKKFAPRRLLPWEPPKAGLVPKARNKGAQEIESDEETQDGNSDPAPDLVFTCTKCGFQFSTQDQLEKHEQRMHPQVLVRKYNCKYCPYSSDFPSNVAIHQRTHTGERPFMCNICEKRFITRYELTHHVRTHTRERPSVCADCGQQFTRTSYLTRHRKTRHPINGKVAWLTCSLCGKQFSRRDSLKVHELMHKGEKRHACSHCGAKFTTRGNARVHERKFHGHRVPNLTAHSLEPSAALTFTVCEETAGEGAYHATTEGDQPQCSDE